MVDSSTPRSLHCLKKVSCKGRMFAESFKSFVFVFGSSLTDMGATQAYGVLSKYESAENMIMKSDDDSGIAID